jgi:hypothetical protein
VAEPSRPSRTNSRCCLRSVVCPSKHRSKRRQQLTARTWSNTRPQYIHLPSRSPFSAQLACTIMTPDNLDCGCRTDSGALSVVRRRPMERTLTLTEPFEPCGRLAFNAWPCAPRSLSAHSLDGLGERFVDGPLHRSWQVPRARLGARDRILMRDGSMYVGL